MKTKITTLLLTLVAILTAQTPKVYDWSTQLQGENWDFANGVEADSKGNIYIAGGFTDNLSLADIKKKNGKCKSQDEHTLVSQGNRDLFIARFNHEGKLKELWSAGGNGMDKITALCMSKDDQLYFSAMTEGDIVINNDTLRQDGKQIILGTVQGDSLCLLKTFSYTQKASGYELDITDDSLLYMGGTFTDTLYTSDTAIVSQGYSDLFVAKLNLKTTQLKLKAIGGRGSERLTAFCSDTAEHCFLAFNYDQSFWHKDTKLQATADKYDKDAVLIQLDSGMAITWQQGFSSPAHLQLIGIEKDSKGQLWLGLNYSNSLVWDSRTIESNGLSDFALIKLDTAYSPQWYRSYGGRYDDRLRNMSLNPAQGLLISGSFNDSLTMDDYLFSEEEYSNVFVATISHDGEVVWGSQLPDERSRISKKAVLDADGHLYLTGTYRDTTAGVYALDDEDIYLAKYCNCPELSGLINGRDFIYPGDYTTLHVPMRFDNIVWQDSISKNKITVYEPGIYTVAMTDKNGCLIRDTLVVEQAYALEFDLGADTTLWVSDTLLLKGPEAAVHYVWQNGSREEDYLACSFNGQPGIERYELKVTDAWGREYRDHITITYIKDVDDEHGLDNESVIRIHPNPIKNSIHWEVLSEEWTDFEVLLSNSLGLVVYQKSIKNYDANTIKTIPGNQLPQGNYALKIVANDGRSAETVVIKE